MATPNGVVSKLADLVQVCGLVGLRFHDDFVQSTLVTYTGALTPPRRPGFRSEVPPSQQVKHLLWLTIHPVAFVWKRLFSAVANRLAVAIAYLKTTDPPGKICEYECAGRKDGGGAFRSWDTA
jgi:hypothetical protein